MPAIKVTSRRNNPDLYFLDKIYLTVDKSIYVALNSWMIVYVDEEGNEIVESKPRKPEWFYMLRELIENNGDVLSPDVIFEASVWGASRVKFENDVDRKVDDIYKEILKQKFYKIASKKGLVLNKHSLKDDGINGYVLYLPPQGDNLWEEFDVNEEPLRPILTDTPVPDTSEIIHRDVYVKQIKEAVSAGVKAICISGFGGLGKTSVAQILYKEYTNGKDKIFDHVGYISYKGGLKTSMVDAMSYLYEHEDANKIWERLSVRLRNNNRKKLLIIDNVDRDEKSLQDPLSTEDAEVFQAISGWPNMTCILTSRLEKIPGFTSYYIDTLGNDYNPQPCIDLFNLYNSKFKNEVDTIKKIVKYCNYHTYAIELVAKASKSRRSLEEFFVEFRNRGFNATNLNIKTKYRKFNNNTTAAIQIKNLFDISSRSVSDRDILESFAVLPDMEQISEDELYSWFGYSQNDVIQLVEEDWMRCYRGKYYVHPLVKEAILLGYDEKRLPIKAAGQILVQVSGDEFFFYDDEYRDFSRKVRICDSVVEHVNIKDDVYHARLSLSLANNARFIGNREIALRQYEESENLFSLAKANLNYEETILFWKAKYYRGYVLSYTNSKLTEAEKYLKEALELSEKIYQNNPTRKNKEHLATSMDHLGYVLSNTEKYMTQARRLLERAYRLRYELEAEYPGEYKQMVAWSADNLGFLLSFFDDTKEKAEKYLSMALIYRKELANGEASSEVAWTASNLGCLYLMEGLKYDEAEMLMKEALFIYQDLELVAPKTHYASMAYICNNYGMLLIKGFNRIQEAIEQLKKALAMYRKLEKDYPESYFQENAMVCSNIANILQKYSIEASREIDAYYQEAITILEEKYRNSPKLKGDKNLALMIADINYNYWVYMLRDDKYSDKRRKCRRVAISFWKKDESFQDMNVESFAAKSETDELYGNTKEFYPLVYYIQGGARKRRIWSNDF